MTDYKKKYNELMKALEKKYPETPIWLEHDEDGEPVALMVYDKIADYNIEIYLENLEDDFSCEMEADNDCFEIMIYGYNKKEIIKAIEQALGYI